jgi:hypothetical protein
MTEKMARSEEAEVPAVISEGDLHHIPILHAHVRLDVHLEGNTVHRDHPHHLPAIDEVAHPLPRDRPPHLDLAHRVEIANASQLGLAGHHQPPAVKGMT